MTTLETPPTPSYGPDTFRDLAEMARILKANDEALDQTIGNKASLTLSSAAIVLSAGYSASGYSTYKSPTAVKVGALATLESGPIAGPGAFSAGVYYTFGTLPSGFAPAGNLHRLGNGAVYTSTGIVPVQYRVNGSGALQFVCPVAISGAYYLIPPAGMNWTV